MSNNKSKTVVIVGAGAAGLAAASKLASNPKVEVIILEATNKIGGRVREADLGKFKIDHGAQWIHGEEGNVAFQIADKLGIADDDGERLEDLDVLFVDNEGKVVDEDVVDQWEEVIESLEDAGDLGTKMGAKTVGEFYERALEAKVKEDDFGDVRENVQAFKDFYHRYYQNLDGCDDWNQLSFRGSLVLYEELPGNDMVTFKGNHGFMDVLKHLAKDLPKNCVRFNSVVTKITWGENSVKLTVNEEENIEADYCIFTGSLGYLKAKEEELFEPRLPEDKLKLIHNLEFGLVDKIHLIYDQEWWPEDIEGFEFLHPLDCENFDYSNEKEATRDWTRWILGLYRVMHKPGVMAAWVTAAGARQMEKESDEEVTRKLTVFFKKTLGKRCPKLTAPKEIKRSRWLSDPYAKGSYCYHGLNADKLNICSGDFAKSDSTKRLRFAGEATHQRFFSTVHGAIETGFREANKILEHIN